MKVKWVPGRGAQGNKGDYVSFKTKGAAYYAEPTWSWLVKNVKRTKIIVRWWTGPSEHEGQWNTQEFLPTDLAAAKRVAKQISQDSPYVVYIFGEGYAYVPHRREMDVTSIYDFGYFEPEGRKENPIAGIAAGAAVGTLAGYAIGRKRKKNPSQTLKNRLLR